MTTTANPTDHLSTTRFLSFTTYRKGGTPVSSPVWIVDNGDGRIAFITSGNSWKVKRLGRNQRAEVQASNYKGNVLPGSAPHSAHCEVVSGAEFERVNDLVRAKYGFQLRIINFLHVLPKLVGRPTHLSNCAVLITIE